MSGHSKWHNIQAKKGKTDAQRGKIFTKLGRELAVAVKEGGADPDSNSRLRDAIEKAKKILSDLNGTHLQDKNFYHLSSGEQMKVLLARALMLNPKLLILDEPNVYLDMKEREVLLSAVEDLAKENVDLTIIFISQRIEDILPLFDKGMILKDGNIAIQGKREDVLTVENIKKAFDIEVELVNSKNGRLWAMTK